MSILVQRDLPKMNKWASGPYRNDPKPYTLNPKTLTPPPPPPKKKKNEINKGTPDFGENPPIFYDSLSPARYGMGDSQAEQQSHEDLKV